MSITHRALAINEVLALIFCFLDDKSNATNARVCKRWSELALEVLWHDINAACLIHSLGYRNEHYHKQVPGLDAWTRWAVNAERVRSIRAYDGRNAPQGTLKGEGLWHEMKTISIFRPRMVLCPRLRSLTWLRMERDFLPLFLNDTVTHFTLSYLVGDISTYSDRMLAQLITTRMPNLTSLDLRIGENAITKDAMKFLVDLIDGLPCLEVLTERSRVMQPQVLEALSRRRKLKTISLGCDRKDTINPKDRGYDRTCPQGKASFNEDAFPCLVNLSIRLPLPAMNHLLRHDYFPASRLTTLIFRMVFEEPTEEIEGLIRAVAEQCLCLRKLGLLLSRPIRQQRDSFDENWEEAWGEDSDSDNEDAHDSALPLTQDDINAILDAPTAASTFGPLHFGSLSPLLALKHLHRLDIWHTRALNMSDDDVIHLAERLPLLRKLNLNIVPDGHESPLLTIGVLAGLAKARPEFHSLALYLNVESTTLQAVLDRNKGPMPRFQRLETLALGPSPLQKSSCTTLALFLSRIVQAHTMLGAGRSFKRFLIGCSCPEHMLDNWDTVRTSVPDMVLARMDHEAMMAEKV
ncbi:hypothetical protein EWM64_g9604 [Hericium alpestre]|uniref:F-box domain-containing protein n=1 Tax=Hericium alpestre TaxID=135208 RepID=A0A4Y9ZLK0_9AGAM|nr:hypothetical protein EWM64_g9604 [Hericium alpestre]